MSFSTVFQFIFILSLYSFQKFSIAIINSRMLLIAFYYKTSKSANLAIKSQTLRIFPY